MIYEWNFIWYLMKVFNCVFNFCNFNIVKENNICIIRVVLNVNERVEFLVKVGFWVKIDSELKLM